MPIARARVARFTRETPRSASAVYYVLHAEIRLSKSHHRPKLWASQNIFAGQTTFDFCPNIAISWAKPDVAAPDAGLAGKPMEAQP